MNSPRAGRPAGCPLLCLASQWAGKWSNAATPLGRPDRQGRGGWRGRGSRGLLSDFCALHLSPAQAACQSFVISEALRPFSPPPSPTRLKVLAINMCMCRATSATVAIPYSALDYHLPCCSLRSNFSALLAFFSYYEKTHKSNSGERETFVLPCRKICKRFSQQQQQLQFFGSFMERIIAVNDSLSKCVAPY